MSRPWMPFYVGDYLRDTQHLTTVEHGAYLLLIMEYWVKGGLPNNDKRLASIARLSLEQWMSIRAEVASFFGPEWTHARIDQEINKSAQAYEKRANAGRKGGLKKASNASSNATAMQEALLYQPQPQSQTLLSEESSDPSDQILSKSKRAKPRSRMAEDAQPSDRDRAAAADAGMSSETFRIEWRKFRDHHLSKGSLMADWAAAWRTWCANHKRFAPAERAPPDRDLRSPLIRAAQNIAQGLKNGPDSDCNVVEIIVPPRAASS